ADTTAERIPDQAHEPQDIEVARRVVVEEVPAVEARQAVGREVVRPEAERVEVRVESGAGEQVCDDEARGEPEREDAQDRAHGALRPGGPWWRSRAPLGPIGCGASHRENGSCTSVGGGSGR